MNTPFDPPVMPVPAPPTSTFPWGWAGVAGAAVAVLGSFLPWASVLTIFGSVDIAGTTGDGKITLVLALIVGSCLLVAVVNRQEASAIAGGVAAACGVAMSVYDYTTVSDRIGAVQSSVARAEVGIGLYVCIGGFVLATVGAFATRALINPLRKTTFVVPPAAGGSY
jgi:hypothetical protein